MTIQIIDTPQPVQRFLPRLGGVHSIIRYITSRSPGSSKHIHTAEARAIKAAGKKLGIVHEVYGSFKRAGHGGISAADGRYDGPYAVRAMEVLGAPPGAGCYFAVDTDGTAAQLKNNVLPYFREVAKAFEDSPYRVGIYGPGRFCQATKDAGYTKLHWLANAKGWSGFKAFKPQADLVQALPTHIAGGLDVDPNVAQVDDWGQFDPFSDARNIDEPGVEPEEVAELTEDETQRLGQGDRVPLTVADAIPEGDDLPSSFMDGAKSLFKSKIAWLGGGLGGTAASTAISSDPQAQSILVQFASRPVVWLGALCLVLAGMIIYYRWRDHGRGKQ